MSRIAGQFRLDGGPARPEGVQLMLAATGCRGEDEVARGHEVPIALGHAMVRTPAESAEEHQPLRDRTGTVCLTLDGRVDNRADLLHALVVRGHAARDSTDA